MIVVSSCCTFVRVYIAVRMRYEHLRCGCIDCCQQSVSDDVSERVLRPTLLDTASHFMDGRVMDV